MTRAPARSLAAGETPEKPDLSYPKFWSEPAGRFDANNGELYATTSAAAVLAGGLLGYGSTDDKAKTARNTAIGGAIGLTGVLALMAYNYVGWRKQRQQQSTSPAQAPMVQRGIDAIATRDLPAGARLVAEIAPAGLTQGGEFEAKQVELRAGQCYAIVATSSDPTVDFDVFLRSVADKNRVLHEPSYSWISIHRITCSDSGPFMFGIHNISAPESRTMLAARLYEVSP